MEAERALVTGGTGFLGSHLVRELVQNGFEVHAVGRSSGDVIDRQAMNGLVAEVRPTHVSISPGSGKEGSTSSCGSMSAGR